MPKPANPADTSRPGMGFKQFVAFVAAVMATNALAIDTMLPALPVIGQALGIVTDNERQWIVTAYLLGFGAAQIVYGTLADRYGRRPVLLFALGVYALFSAVAGFAGTFGVMLVARVLQGIGAAGTRVLAISIIRDRYAGRQMARVMSLAFIVFLAVPIAAPSLGQLIMRFAPWPAIFFALAVFAATVVIWAAIRLPETLHEEDRLAICAPRILGAFRLALSERQAVGYMLAMTVMIGGLFGYINSVQQVFSDVFHAAPLFPHDLRVDRRSSWPRRRCSMRASSADSACTASRTAPCSVIVLVAAVHAARRMVAAGRPCGCSRCASRSCCFAWSRGPKLSAPWPWSRWAISPERPRRCKDS
jgi:MFS transporter, DHA1 family, multidrug resistance protein